MNLYSKAAGSFYHDYESYDESSRLKVREKRLSEVLAAAQRTPFYRELWKGKNADLSAFEFLKSLPKIEANQLREALPPISNRLMSRPSEGYSVFQSGGTTGMPKTSLFTFEEMEQINECNTRGFFAVGLRPEDKVANLWAVGGLYMTFVHMNRMMMEYGCESFPFSNQTPVDFMERVAGAFGINCFSGITSVVLRALREIHAAKNVSLKIDKVFFGGEHIYQADRQELLDKFGVTCIKAPGYGTVDSWYLGYQCSHTSNGMFHAFDDQALIEILDEESGEPVLEGQVGLLHSTPLLRTFTPIVRFRVGDRARWVGTSCPCGRSTPLFELLGRGDDVLRIGYDSVDYNFVQSLVSQVGGLSGRVQMVKRRESGKDKLILRIECTLSEEQQQSKRSDLIELFMDERPSFKEFEKKNTIWPLEIEWLKEGSLPQNPRTGKLVRIVDAI